MSSPGPAVTGARPGRKIYPLKEGRVAPLKKITKIAASLALALGLLLNAAPAWGLTTDLELVGEAAGLVLMPAEGKLFDLGKMNPGDTRSAKITIKNNYTKCYDLWMRAEDLTAQEPSLLEIIELTFLYCGKEIYRGPVDGLAGGTIYLGRFRPGEGRELVATVHLPGPETGNEFQGKSASANWVFMAQSSDEGAAEPAPPGKLPDLPKTGGEGAFCYYLLGGLAMLAGTRLGCKRSRR